MPVASFDFSSLLPAGLPPAAAKWNGTARYNFIGGNNDPAQIPVDGLVAAATEGAAVARVEPRTQQTPYVRWGEWWVLLVGLLLGAGTVRRWANPA